MHQANKQAPHIDESHVLLVITAYWLLVNSTFALA